jgi:hypothetical protein
MRRLQISPRKGLSDSGVAFLKCAFAPPDFQSSSVSGVPDTYVGPSLVRKHRYVAAQTLTAGQDYYFLLAPVPGVSHFMGNVAAGTNVIATTTYTAVNYSGFTTMFPSLQSTDSIVTKYRYVSNHFELIPTVNQFTWSGSIQCWKIPLTVAIKKGGTGVDDLLSVSGLEGLVTSMANQYSAPFLSGVYTACYSSNPTFEFQEILNNIVQVPNTVNPLIDFGQLVGTGGFTGLDNGFESMVIKISGITTNQTCLIKTWACVEYQINASSSLYEFQSLSPEDPLALELYRKIINGLPIGVPFDQNEGFWDRVLSIIQSISGMASVIPGPYGGLARGVNLASGSIRSLLNR